MSISTQLRLTQLSGSFGTGTGTVRDDLGQGSAPNAASQKVEDYADMLGMLASSIKRINGNGEWFNNQAAGKFSHNNPTFDTVTTMVVKSTAGQDVHFALACGAGDADGDTWQQKVEHDDNTLAFQNKISASWQEFLKLTPHATVSDSTVAVGGRLQIDSNEIINSNNSIWLDATGGDATNVPVSITKGTGTLTVAGSGGVAAVSLQRLTGGSLDIQGGNDATGGDNVHITAGDVVKLGDQYSEDSRVGGKLTAQLVPLASSKAEWDTFVDNNSAGTSIINAINAASSGSPSGVDKYTTTASGKTSDGKAGVIMVFKAEACTAGGKVRIPYVESRR